ncbi:MAG: hypothetical protein AUJ52_06315 [Elusimicrobia bacterium CG1_02_63_36]|nr:MAG: hypothetical protein AUJ52_06315 [Elusimicrobia bacterium CG1_02_63_36]PIP81852.1 MAG: hypothetical protein COR54_17980 [Elusimicrobia bacterium CG22_combo_CG10-13_8_21_14_all_63_91]PJA17550.1 MAG: hypothetical protein COX66_04070 [Elusimicrobia bacterium CG_4_10_14_0_2_um_filter_63_34]PJB26291.1 MAG: hypothetical protein CO113_04255 [Elusimicrobia bacterium CG_4_9_14_3_um_filter_62_55]
MKSDIVLRQDAEGALWIEEAPRPPRRVVTVAAACRRLRRSRRQVYRLMKAGRLGPSEKMLGEWLLDQAAVERLARAPLSAQPLPGRLKPLFPEYELKALNAGRDGVLIISRVLEDGGLEDLRWLLKRYPSREIRRVIEEEGSRLLSPRSRRLWSRVFKSTPQPVPTFVKRRLKR